ncbi:MAG: hypothetical protein A2X22_03180 [Bacteroidetes bacterium GWF2_49_14]|nr:MAG: hypothetical protein A2X22_03180 [Bacteroidetes bacterium GWF2_49_14]
MAGINLHPANVQPIFHLFWGIPVEVADELLKGEVPRINLEVFHSKLRFARKDYGYRESLTGSFSILRSNTQSVTAIVV